MRSFVGALAAAWASSPAAAQSAEVAAKRLANPIARQIRVPFSLNYNAGIGSQNGDQVRLRIRPLVPFRLSDDWDLITQTLIPIVHQDDVIPGEEDFGTGDIVSSLYLSPSTMAEGGAVWGVGPVFLLPAATDKALGGRTWGAGPAGAVIKQTGGWTYGVIANHVWSFAGSSDRDVSASYLQPLVAYTTPGGTTYSLDFEGSYSWTTETGIAPINATVSRVFGLGDGRHVQLGVGVRYWLGSTVNGPEGLGGRVNVTFVLPK